tara:strand:- start:137 stop:1153 length:1017 start_codon:yes stop_codon:yes gene_type:complete
MKKRNQIIFFACIAAVLITSCIDFKNNSKEDKTIYCNNSFDPVTWDSCNYTSFTSQEFSINILDRQELPYVRNSTNIWKKDNYDANSVPLHTFKGKKNYHPVYIAQSALNIVDVYVNTKDSSHLKKLENIADKLIGMALEVDSALFFTYTFDFQLHDCEEETMLAPWYSAMAQGQILSFFCRVYEATNDARYLQASRKIFNSFTRLKGEGHEPWVSCVDKNGNLWLEEYPRDLPCFTLNGKVFAIYGVYDFYRISNDKYAKEILNAAITTLKVNIHKFRDKNEVSWYCLKHNNYHGKNKKYHKIHVDQLRMLYKISGDIYFEQMADKFQSDFVLEVKK